MNILILTVYIRLNKYVLYFLLTINCYIRNFIDLNNLKKKKIFNLTKKIQLIIALYVPEKDNKDGWLSRVTDVLIHDPIVRNSDTSGTLGSCIGDASTRWRGLRQRRRKPEGFGVHYCGFPRRIAKDVFDSHSNSTDRRKFSFDVDDNSEIWGKGSAGPIVA